jgi:hypothetical protein
VTRAAPTVRLDLPESWVRVPVAADGDRAGQRALLEGWCRGQPPDELVRRLVRESREAHRAGMAFAAVLLASAGTPAIAVSAALTVGFRQLSDAPTDARVAAEGVLRVLRDEHRPTRRVELVGLAGDPDRPAVLVQERTTRALAEVLWLVPGSDQLAGISVTSADLPLAARLTEVALSAALSLRVDVSGR